jgi:hypothetical protein
MGSCALSVQANRRTTFCEPADEVLPAHHNGDTAGSLEKRLIGRHQPGCLMATAESRRRPYHCARKTISRSIYSTASNTSNSGSGNDLSTISRGWLTTPTQQTRQACTESAQEPTIVSQVRFAPSSMPDHRPQRLAAELRRCPHPLA